MDIIIIEQADNTNGHKCELSSSSSSSSLLSFKVFFCVNDLVGVIGIICAGIFTQVLVGCADRTVDAFGHVLHIVGIGLARVFAAVVEGRDTCKSIPIFVTITKDILAGRLTIRREPIGGRS